MDRVTRIDLPGRLWKATRGKTAETNQRMPCFVAGPENRLVAVAMESLLRTDPRLADPQIPIPGKTLPSPQHPQPKPGQAVAATDDSPAGKIPPAWVDNGSHSALVFNPLILLGATGCGKSHLAGGIANHWHAVLSGHTVQTRSAQAPPTSWCDLFNLFNPQTGKCESRHVAYLSSNDFGRMVRQAREQNKTAELRLAFVDLRLLVLEELHLMRLSRVIQQELQLVMDQLLTRGAVILVTSQQPLTMITALEGGLRDRLSAGLTVRLKPPGHAARLELLQLAADRRGTELDLNSARRLSQQVEGSAPQLFQALARLEHQRAQANLSRANPRCANFTGSIATAPILRDGHRDRFRDEPSHETLPPRKNVTMRQIIAVVARYFSVSQVQLRGNSRRRTIVHARGVAVYLARMLTDLSYAQIGHHLGKRDHTTAMHANRKLQQLFATDSLTQECVEDLKRILTAC
jgi:chromosomal replication initiator protein